VKDKQRFFIKSVCDWENQMIKLVTGGFNVQTTLTTGSNFAAFKAHDSCEPIGELLLEQNSEVIEFDILWNN